MTVEKLKEEANRLGYLIVKKPCYQCHCYLHYPNPSHKKKNGEWKCVDKYKPMKWQRKYEHQPLTKCVLKEDTE